MTATAATPPPDLWGEGEDADRRTQRISETMRCRRQRVLVGRGHPLDSVPPRLKGIYERGEQIEQYGIRVIRAELAKAGFDGELQLQARVDTPFGPGHLDVAAVGADETFIYDVKSKAKPHHVDEFYAWQLRAYARYWWAQHGVRPEKLFIVMVDPSDLEDTWLPVYLKSAHIEAIDAEEALIADLVRRRELYWADYPERLCEKPSDGTGRFCRVVGECFKDWAPTPAGELEDPTVIDLAERLALKQLEAKRLGDAISEVKHEIEALRDGLRAVAPAGQEMRAGRAKLKRSEFPVARFSLSDAEKAGAGLPEECEPFVSVTVQERWTAELVDEDEGSLRVGLLIVILVTVLGWLSLLAIVAEVADGAPLPPRAVASAYGPGLYGNPTGCRRPRGSVRYLTPTMVGVAHRSLPCNTVLQFRSRHGRWVTAAVIDRGPAHRGRTFDLTYALVRKLGYRDCREWGVRSVAYRRAPR